MKRSNLVRLLSLLLTGALLLGLVPAMAADYPDMPTDWAHDAVQAGVDAGLIVADGEGKLNPTKPLTRAEVADIMVRAFGSGGKADLSSFRDIPAGHPYYDALASAVFMGLMSGGGGKMDPDGAVTREQAFVILNNSLKVGSDPAAVARFSDAGKISDWAKGACGALVAKGYVSGSGDKLNPQNGVTKQELLQILYNIFGTNYDRAAGAYTASTEKSLVVSASGAALAGLEVKGDLVIGDSAALATLESVKVNGRLVVRCGGAVQLLNCNVNDVVKVNDKAKITIQSTGSVARLETGESDELSAVRQTVLDYMRAESQIKWTPDHNIQNDSSNKATFEKGVTYTGMPYSNDVDASMMEFKTYLDANNVYIGPDEHGLRGVDCSSSILAAWCQVAASVDYAWTWQMLPYSNYRGSHGASTVGDYKLPVGTDEKPIQLGTADNWQARRTTTGNVLEINDKQAMFECYAQTLPGDAMVTYMASGHARMVSKKPLVVRKADGTIDPEKSIITTIEITNTPFRVKDSSGNTLYTCWSVDYERTFQNFYDDYYIPVTCPELVEGKAAVPEVSLDNAQDPAANKGLTGSVRSNFRLFRVAASVEDASGKQVAYAETYPLNMVTLAMVSNNCDLTVLNEQLNIASLPAGTYVLKLTATVGTQEVPVVTQAFQL